MQILHAVNPSFALSGFLVGVLVGLTGGWRRFVNDTGSRADFRPGHDCSRNQPPLRRDDQDRRHRRAPGNAAPCYREHPDNDLYLDLLYEFGVRGGASPPLITIILACALILTTICVVSQSIPHWRRDRAR